MDVYFNRLEQGAALPAVVLNKISADHKHHFRGAAGVCVSLFQFSIFSTDYKDVLTLSRELRETFDGFKGNVGEVEILAAFVHNEIDLPEPPGDSSDDWTYHRAIDISFWHRESVPEFE